MSRDSAKRPNVTARYELGEVLGSGGMGEVFEAFDKRRGISVALKALRTAGPESVAQLKREFRSVAQLRHPNLVRLYDLVCIPGYSFFTMELIQGQDLFSYVCASEEAPSLTTGLTTPFEGASTK